MLMLSSGLNLSMEFPQSRELLLQDKASESQIVNWFLTGKKDYS